jgi:peptide deformylase
MALRPVLQFPDPRLKRVSRPIEKITDEIRALAQDMLDVMYDEPGIGLAAPQVGEPVRLIADTHRRTRSRGEKSPLVLVNPSCSARGPWSGPRLPPVPDFRRRRARGWRIRDSTRGPRARGGRRHLRAVCFQHEIDRLDGVLFIDRMAA